MKFSKKHKENISKSHEGEKNSMFGVHRFGKDAPMYGKHHSEKTKRKMSRDRKGENHPNFKFIDEKKLANFIQNHTLKETANYFGCSITVIQKRLENFNLSEL